MSLPSLSSAFLQGKLRERRFWRWRVFPPSDEVYAPSPHAVFSTLKDEFNL
jgi:hypothetical protein